MESCAGSTILDARQERDACFRGVRYGQLLTHLSCFVLGGSEKGQARGRPHSPGGTKRSAKSSFAFFLIEFCLL